MGTRSDSGRVWLSDGVIHYDSEVYGTWSLPLTEVHVIGEYTNQDGPGADDFFVAFARSADEMWFEASSYAEGTKEFLMSLGDALGVQLECSLYWSADFNSLVWWPRELTGQPMFDFRYEGLKGKLGLENKQYLSSAVVAYLRKAHDRGAV